MDSYLVRPCNECGTVFEALDRVNSTLTKYAKNKYQNNAYQLNKVFPKQKIKHLIRYKNILEDCIWTPNFYEPYFPVANIISKVKLLINGL